MFRRSWSVLPFFLIGCNDSPPGPPPVSSIQLAVEDASCTEAWLKVTFTDSNQPRTIALRRDRQTVLTAQLTGNDSILIDEGLLPNHAYTYQVVRLRDSVAVDASANAQATTLDTTSHNWSFVLDTLGDGNSSVLNDVAIIHDSLAYAVGEIYLRDSTGQLDPHAYNMAKWDGVSWQPMRIQFYTICGQASRTPYPASSVFAFSATDVWITSRGGQLAHWNGTTQTATICNPDPFVINKLWGENANSILAVGYDGQVGRIGHFAFGTWQRIESGTTLDVYDIFGQRNSITGEQEVYAVAAKQFVSFDKRILKIAGNSVSAVSDSGIPYSLHGIWFKAGRKYCVAGSGLYSKNTINSATSWKWLHPGVTDYYLYAIRGNEINDLFSCGSFGELIHYNGISWTSFRATTSIAQGALYEISVKGNVSIAVGYDAPRAIAAIGRR